VSAAPQDRQNFLPCVTEVLQLGQAALKPGATVLAEARARVVLSLAPGTLHDSASGEGAG
jgi:hypothetical protein